MPHQFQHFLCVGTAASHDIPLNIINIISFPAIMSYDVIIIGAGPAGLTAATNTAHRGLSTLVIEQYEKCGGQPLILYPDKVIKDHPGFPVGIIGKEFARLLEYQARNAGAEIHCNEEVLTFRRTQDEHLEVKTTSGTYAAKKIILCTGGLNMPATIPMLKGLENVFYKPRNLDKKFKGKKVVIIGGGDNAFDTAISITELTSHVTILVKQPMAKAKEFTVREAAEKGIKVIYEADLVSVNKSKDGKRAASLSIVDRKTGKTEILEVDAVFSAIGFSVVSSFLKENGIEQEPDGRVKIDKNFETSVKGVYAAGDLMEDVKLIAVACSRGIEAAIKAFSSIKKPYWIN